MALPNRWKSIYICTENRLILTVEKPSIGKSDSLLTIDEKPGLYRPFVFLLDLELTTSIFDSPIYRWTEMWFHMMTYDTLTLVFGVGL